MPEGLLPVSHFAGDGAFYQEVAIEATRFVAQPLRYEFASGKLTLFFRNGAQSHLDVVEEPEGTIKTRRADGQTWSMVRLAAPEPFSLAFVDAAGLRPIPEGQGPSVFQPRVRAAEPWVWAAIPQMR